MHVFVHLLNDFSGSPRILNDKIRVYRELGESCFVITNSPDGFISLEEGAHQLVSYAKHRNRIIWAFKLLAWYPRAALAILAVLRRGDTLHCNTLLTAPLLAAGRLRRAQCVSHVMETRIKPPLFKALLRSSVRMFADRVVYLSRYVAAEEAFPGTRIKVTTTYPAVDRAIFSAGLAHRSAPGPVEPGFRVGLICSLVWYKGVREFVSLARAVSDESMSFILVLNGTRDALARMLNGEALPANLEVHTNVRDVSALLARMHVLLSLTNRTGWVETFGLTLVEAMAFGKPVIAPNVGAPVEFVVPGENGYLVDESDLSSVLVVLRRLAGDPQLYSRLSSGASRAAAAFSPEAFREAVKREIDFLSGSPAGI